MVATHGKPVSFPARVTPRLRTASPAEVGGSSRPGGPVTSVGQLRNAAIAERCDRDLPVAFPGLVASGRLYAGSDCAVQRIDERHSDGAVG